MLNWPSVSSLLIKTKINYTIKPISMAQELHFISSKSDSLFQEIISWEHHYSSLSSSSSTPISIYTVPATLRQLKPSAYTPRVVSIGLLHSKDDRFKHANEYKMSYMHTLFHRSAKSEETRKKDVQDTVSQCADAMSALAERARSSYEALMSSELDDKSIARTMLVDGCFVLELLMRWSNKRNRVSDPLVEREISDDPIIGNNFVLLDVEHDLFLLENQIPFFILDKLFELTIKRIQNRPNTLTLTDLILLFFGNMMMNSDFGVKIKDGINENADHILGLLQSCYQPGKSDPGDYSVIKYSATDLHRSGVNFRPSNGDDDDVSVYLCVDFQKTCLFPWLANAENSLFNNRTNFKTRKLPVSENHLSKKLRAHNEKSECCLFSCLCQLCCRATLEIPKLRITDSTEPFLRNLIAFEQCSQNTPRQITSYAFLMDTIIDSKEDVELLETANVLTNLLGSSEDASNLFNNLCKEVFLGRFYYSSQWQQVANYRQLHWPRRIASLKRTYFSSPWTGISVVAALILFVFTGIQTVCSLISLRVKH